MAIERKWALLGSAFTAAVMLSACGATTSAPRAQAMASSSANASEESEILDLPPQTLRDGQCGLFFWTQSLPHRFIVFEHERYQSVSILYDGEIHTLGVTPQSSDYLEGEPFRRVYLDQDNRRVYTLDGQIGERTSAGPRIERAVMRVRDNDGRQVVMPVIGLFSCRTENDGYIPGVDDALN
ncbi:hypothetical protein [Woodsholea maritima]|uniref:hypothetical protein n=1 Tax=Woodsholea maritima TaxID=240237 RepID=UPI00035E27FE|nr:hypothetical protein [Woodsholea maritima]